MYETAFCVAYFSTPDVAASIRTVCSRGETFLDVAASREPTVAAAEKHCSYVEGFISGVRSNPESTHLRGAVCVYEQK